MVLAERSGKGMFVYTMSSVVGGEKNLVLLISSAGSRCLRATSLLAGRESSEIIG
jgi:hypothetical protein